MPGSFAIRISCVTRCPTLKAYLTGVTMLPLQQIGCAAADSRTLTSKMRSHLLFSPKATRALLARAFHSPFVLVLSVHCLNVLPELLPNVLHKAFGDAPSRFWRESQMQSHFPGLDM